MTQRISREGERIPDVELAEMQDGKARRLGRDEGRRAQVISYFLWDWFDGSLSDGW